MINRLFKHPSYVVIAGAFFVVALFFLWSGQLLQSTPVAVDSKPIPITQPRKGLYDVKTPYNGTWNFVRDRKNYLLSSHQCDTLFPDLYKDLDRAIKDRNGKKITLKEIDSIKPKNGFIRGIIYDQQLYIIQTEGQIYSRGIATLLSLNRAITTSPEPLPNIEFTFSEDDWLPPTPQWALARKAGDTATWLMPDYGYWSWPETKVGGYGEVQDKALEMENSSDNPTGKAWEWSAKFPKALWRGATMGLELREKLLKVTEGKPWADVKSLDWHNAESMGVDLKSMDEHCQYKYLVNTAGNSYSGRLKYIQNCRSVILMHDMEWFTHHTHLMKADGDDQNYVQVKRDFDDLEEVVEALRKNDTMAQKIADESVKTFRERYLTPAAEACYWRRLIRTWADISFEPEFWEVKDGKRKWRGLPVESFVLERRLKWDPY